MTFTTFVASIAAACSIVATANNSWTAAHTAADAGNDAKLTKLLRWKPALANARDSGDHTPLHLASWSGRRHAAEILLDNGADINAPDGCGWTPLHTATVQNHPEVVKVLLARGANANAPDKRGQTPLRAAIRYKRAPIAELLHQHGAHE